MTSINVLFAAGAQICVLAATYMAFLIISMTHQTHTCPFDLAWIVALVGLFSLLPHAVGLQKGLMVQGRCFMLNVMCAAVMITFSGALVYAAFDCNHRAVHMLRGFAIASVVVHLYAIFLFATVGGITWSASRKTIQVEDA
jgi:hypothetical protein